MAVRSRISTTLSTPFCPRAVLEGVTAFVALMGGLHRNQPLENCGRKSSALVRIGVIGWQMQRGDSVVTSSTQSSGKAVVCRRETIVRRDNESGPVLKRVNLGQEAPLRRVSQCLTR